jgi:hypothetical protein
MILTSKLQFILSCALYFSCEITVVLDTHTVDYKVLTKQVDVIGEVGRSSADRSIGTASLLACFINTTAISRNYYLNGYSRTHKHRSLYSVIYLSFDTFL